MNNAKRTLTSIAAILMAVTLVVGTAGTFLKTTQSAFAANNKNGNTITAQKDKQDGTASGFDNLQEQETQNVICTHPGENSTCSQESTILLTCEQCFTTMLKHDEITRLLTALSAMGADTPSIARVCNILEGKDPRNSVPTEDQVRTFLSQQVGLKDHTINELITCLKQAGIVFALTPPPT